MHYVCTHAQHAIYISFLKGKHLFKYKKKSWTHLQSLVKSFKYGLGYIKGFNNYYDSESWLSYEFKPKNLRLLDSLPIINNIRWMYWETNR